MARAGTQSGNAALTGVQGRAGAEEAAVDLAAAQLASLDADTRLIASIRSLSGATSVAIIAVGSLVLVGWLFDIGTLKSIFPGLVTMKANTALAFILLGLSLWLLGERTQRRGGLGQLSAFTAALVGLLTFSEYLFGWNLGIDQLLFDEPLGAVGTSQPGRMAPTTALDFLLLGLALLFLDSRQGYWLVQLLIVAAALIALIAFVGYVYRVESLYGVASHTRMAVHTSLTFVVLSCGILLAHPGRGLFAAVVSEGVGGVMARRLLPATVVIPLLLGWLRLVGQRAGFYDTEFGTSLMVVAVITILAIIVWWSAGVSNRTDMQRKRAGEEIRRHAAELEAVNRELEAFAYSVSHDLRAPLRSVDGFSQALLEDYADKVDEQGREQLQRVRAGAQRMGLLIDDLLNLSRVTRAEIRREPVDLSGLAESIAQELRQTEPRRQAEFAITDGLIAQGDARLLRVALANLLNNAWKFTAPHPSARIEFGVMQQPGGGVAYFVRDDGVGFDMAYVDKLFGAFQRLHSTTEFPGTGVGLASVQRIIHRHGGRVWAEGATEKGATFYFTL